MPVCELNFYKDCTLKIDKIASHLNLSILHPNIFASLLTKRS